MQKSYKMYNFTGKTVIKTPEQPTTHSSARYCGAQPCKRFNTSRHSLNLMRCGMSIQCRSSRRNRVYRVYPRKACFVSPLSLPFHSGQPHFDPHPMVPFSFSFLSQFLRLTYVCPVRRECVWPVSSRDKHCV